MIRNKLITTIICLILLAGYTAAVAEEFPRSTLIDTVACLEDARQTYSLYLPVKTEKTPALLVFLEPGARGKLPVGLYKDLAERYNLILASSNNGRNGPDELYRDALDAMIPDLRKRFKTDTARFILSGFSGGARYATVYSMMRMKTGVIACGAGISPHHERDQLEVPYYTGICGRMDMNFIDVIASVQDAELAGTPAWMIANGSGHFWPDTVSFSRAIDQVLVYWHSNGLLNIRDTELARIRRDMYAQFDSLLDTERFYELKMMETNFRSHPLFEPEDPEWLEIAGRIPAGEMKKKSDKEWEKIRNREMDYIDTIMSGVIGIEFALYNQMHKIKPALWWKQQRKQVNRLMNSKDAIVRESGNRSFDYTWRSLWSYGIPHLQETPDPEHAARYFRAWCSFDPESSYAYYLLAASYSMAGHENKSLKALGSASKNGFSRPDLIEKSEAFNALRSNEKFLKILEQIKSNQPSD
jgi:hypothetical protein